jgi:hypothetical protein
MPTVADEVTGPISAMAELSKGLAAKNATMQDGPPDGNGEQPSNEGTQERSAYDRYKDNIDKAWDDYAQHGDATALGLDIGQAVADLAMEGGGDVLRLFGDLLGAGGD